ncbi:MAG: GAF domain-containing protein [Verrucomicrobiales bacterium]|nr:GAF domain-containing protein [Verrucomicrobiales bacterium]
MSDFATALKRIHKHGDGILLDAAEMLRQLVKDTCEAISASEGSILIPSDDQTELRFLVSMNPALEGSDITVSVSRSVSGYVFSSRQAMAKVHPESPGVSKVDEVAQIETQFLLAVPIIDDDRVYGVATFVNRCGEASETPFSIQDLKAAQGFGEIYATAMKLYRKIEFSTSVAELEIAEHVSEFGLEEMGGLARASEVAHKFRIPALIAEKSLSLPEKEREMLSRMADLLGEFAEEEEDRHEDI